MRFIHFLLVGSAAIFAISEGAVPTPSKQLKISSADVLRPVGEAPSRRVLRSRDTAEASEDLSDEERGPSSYLIYLIRGKLQERKIKKVAKLIKDKAKFEKLFSAGVSPLHYFDGLKHNDAVKSPLSKVVANAHREGMQGQSTAFKRFAEYSEYYNAKFMAGDRPGELLKTTAKV